MNINTFKKILPLMLREDFAVPFLYGTHGIGKSQVIEQTCRENGWKLFDFRLNVIADVGDIIGLQDFVKDEQGNAFAVAHMKPQWLEDMMQFCHANPDKLGVVFFDEVNRAARIDIVGPLFQMTTTRRLHIWDFPSNLKIILAANPDTEDYTVLNLQDKALMDRFVHMELTPTEDEFFSFTKSKGCHSLIESFLRESPKFMEAGDLAEFSVGEKATPSRRTWAEIVDRFIKLNEDGVMTDGEFQELMLGTVGADATHAFMAHRQNRNDHPVDPKHILSGNKAELERLDRLIEEGRLDVIKVTGRNLIEHVQSLDKVSQAKVKRVYDFILDKCPADMLPAFIRDLFEPCPFRETWWKIKDYRGDEFKSKMEIAAKQDKE